MVKDDTSSRQPISELRKSMAKDAESNGNGRTSPESKGGGQASQESINREQKDQLDMKKSLKNHAVFLIWSYAPSAAALVVLDGLKIKEFGLSDPVLTAYVIVASGPTSAYFIVLDKNSSVCKLFFSHALIYYNDRPRT